MAAFAAIFSVVSAGIGLAAARSRGKAAEAQASYQAKVAANNTILAEHKAEDTRAIGRIEADRHRRLTRQRIGVQRAVLAASGQTVDQGTALSLTADTAAVGELDALTIISNSERKAYGYETQAYNFESEEKLNRYRAKTARTQSALDTVGSIATFGSTVSRNWENLVG